MSEELVPLESCCGTLVVMFFGWKRSENVVLDQGFSNGLEPSSPLEGHKQRLSQDSLP